MNNFSNIYVEATVICEGSCCSEYLSVNANNLDYLQIMYKLNSKCYENRWRIIGGENLCHECAKKKEINNNEQL